MKIAHLKPETDETQTIAEHSEATADMARCFAAGPLKNIVYCMGLLHDIGKYQPAFQEKITSGKNLRVDHSTCGAIEAGKLFGNGGSALMMKYCIAGHHSGIPDGGTQMDTPDEPSLYGRLKRTAALEDYSAYKEDIKIPECDDRELSELLMKCPQCRTDRECFIEEFAFLTRYCFSCLTDADSLDTAHFCNGREDNELPSDFEECLKKLEKKLESLSSETDLQKARSELQKQVFEKAGRSSEIYLMNMPTGSGKTLCSMKFALMRALRSGKKRIIYVIPYNSIIDQTAAVFEEVFGESADILRHQSSFSIDDTDSDEDYRTLVKNVTENWNAQIIITTSVQFFESLYGNKRGKLRKMHNIADSIIIFDEAHIMPAEYLRPCLRAVSFFTRLLNCEAVFLTATMPDFEEIIKKYALDDSRITELITDRSKLSAFRKSDFVNMGTVSEDRLLEAAMSGASSLIVVNKRKTAAGLFDKAKIIPGKHYHLSTYMSAFDRKRVIDNIRNDLEALYSDYPEPENIPPERRIIVISTSLIEAGVDLDFYAVYRELAGLDSILQAGGRCNREGKRSGAVTSIFTTEESKETVAVNIARSLMDEYGDISSPECVKEYYGRLYRTNAQVISENTIANGVSRPDSIPFARYARYFRMIDDSTVSVAVERDDESRKLIEQLRTVGFTDHRRLQKYTFTVYVNELELLRQQGVVREYGGIWCLENPDYYSSEKGVLFETRDYYC